MAPGIWGRPSSTIDWCEENYAVTRFIAEFWNTLSNLLMIVPPLVTIYLLIQQNFEKKFIACHLSLLSVGIGSWCFHMTLLYSMQLLDELPMIWGTAFLIYAFVEVRSPPNHKNKFLMATLMTYCSIVTIVYIVCKMPIFFQASYAIMVFLVVFVAGYTVKNLECCNTALFLFGIISYGSGFLLWMVDNNFCGSLRVMRNMVGFLSPVLEFHAWWHILAGLGTYLGLIFVAHARCVVLKRRAHIKYWLKFWPYLYIEPVLLIR